MKNRFDFEFDTSILGSDGIFFRVLVIAYDLEEFEVLNMDEGIPVNLSKLPTEDQAAISNRIAQRFAAERIYRKSDIEASHDRAWDIQEMNRERGVG